MTTVIFKPAVIDDIYSVLNLTAMETIVDFLNDRGIKISSLCLSNKALLSRVNFLEDEVQVLKNLLRKHFHIDLQEDIINRIQLIHNQINRFEKQKIVTLNSIFCHQSNLKATIEEMMQLSEQYLEIEHAKVADEVKHLQLTYDFIKEEFLKITQNHYKIEREEIC